MRLCVLHTEWPPRVAAEQPETARLVALPWEALARHVSHVDLSGSGLRAALVSRGAQVACVELPPLTCMDAATFERETDDAYMRLQVVERVGAPLAVIASAHEGEAGFDMAADALVRLAALAERMDVTLAVRNVSGSALARPDALLEVLRRADAPALGVCCDILEFSQELVNPAEAVSAFGGRLAAVCMPARPIAALRVGEAAIRAALDALIQESFSGPVIVEAHEAAYFMQQFGSLLG